MKLIAAKTIPVLLALCLAPLALAQAGTHADGTPITLKVAPVSAAGVPSTPVPALTISERTQIVNLLNLQKQVQGNTALQTKDPATYSRVLTNVGGMLATAENKIRLSHHIPDTWVFSTTTYTFAAPVTPVTAVKK
jgi:hypothetical protein